MSSAAKSSKQFFLQKNKKKKKKVKTKKGQSQPAPPFLYLLKIEYLLPPKRSRTPNNLQNLIRNRLLSRLVVAQFQLFQ